MRIAMVSEHASPLAVLGGVDAGGQNVHVAELALALARRGAVVVVHTRREDPAVARRVALGRGVEVDHVDAGPATVIPKDELLVHMDAFAADLAAQWRVQRPELIHAHFWMSGHAALAARDALAAEGGAPIPVVQTFHALGVVKRRYQGPRDSSPGRRLALEREVLRRADHVIATCTDEVFELLRLDASRAKLTVIPCGADLGRFCPDGPVLPARRPGDRQARVACVGRLVERKGVGTAISALAHLQMPAQLVIAGGAARERLDDDPEVRRLRALAEAVGVSDRVQFLGRLSREDTAAVMRGADVVVAVPWYEPFGIVPIEAMACGTPVVASAVGGMIDTVVDGVTGVHVPPRDPERLADALDALLGDAGRCADLGRAGILRSRRLYDWDRVGAATLDVYRRVSAAGAGRLRGASTRSGGASSAVVLPTGREHLAALRGALQAMEAELDRVERWGERLAGILVDGGRLLTVGNGGSAAEAQHLSAELVGRYITERRPLSAICLHGDTSSLTAIANDYGPEEAFARQVFAHGRPGDVLVAFSTSGRSANVLAAVRAARECGMESWALTGPGPNPLAANADEVLAVPGDTTATVQELHLVALHVLCGAVDRELQLRVPLRDVVAAPSARRRRAALA